MSDSTTAPVPAPAKAAARPVVVPWTIELQHGGSRAGVLAEIAKAQAKDANGKTDGIDQTQIEAAKVYLKTVIDSIPEEFNGVKVLADGRVDSRIGFNSTVIPFKLL